MQNFKYHTLNIIAVMVFSYTSAITINHIIKYNISPVSAMSKISQPKAVKKKETVKSFESYEKIIQAGFFRIATAEDLNPDLKTQNTASASSPITSLTLIGTITGPASIARALISKQGEKDPKIFALRKIDSIINNDVHGYKLTKIFETKVHLTLAEETHILELYKKKELPNKKEIAPQSSSTSSGIMKKVISKAEFKQEVLNDMDNAMKGIVAGPYRINGQIMGFRLSKVSSNNILFKLGARSGDIIQRINGAQVNSTQKLIKLWDNIKNESNIKIDLERQGKPLTFDLTISQ